MQEKNKQLVIVGAGETARVAFEYFEQDTSYQVVGFSADEEFIGADVLNGLPIVPLKKLSDVYDSQTCEVFIAVSFVYLNRARMRLFHALKRQGYTCASYVSSQSFVARSAQIGENCFIQDQCSIQPFVKIGDNVVCGSGSKIAHSSFIDNHVFMASGVTIGGFAKVGESSFLGLNCTIRDNITLCADCVVSAGSVVINDITTPNIYQGFPAKDTSINSLAYVRLRGGRL